MALHHQPDSFAITTSQLICVLNVYDPGISPGGHLVKCPWIQPKRKQIVPQPQQSFGCNCRDKGNEEGKQDTLEVHPAKPKKEKKDKKEKKEKKEKKKHKKEKKDKRDADQEAGSSDDELAALDKKQIEEDLRQKALQSARKPDSLDD